MQRSISQDLVGKLWHVCRYSAEVWSRSLSIFPWHSFTVYLHIFLYISSNGFSPSPSPSPSLYLTPLSLPLPYPPPCFSLSLFPLPLQPSPFPSPSLYLPPPPPFIISLSLSCSPSLPLYNLLTGRSRRPPCYPTPTVATVICLYERWSVISGTVSLMTSPFLSLMNTHYTDVTWVPWRLISPAIRVFNDLFLLTLTTKKTSTTRLTGPFFGESTGHRWVFLTRGQ